MKKEPRRWTGQWLWWVVNLAGAAALVVFWADLQLKPFDGSASAYYHSQLGPDLYDRVWNTDPRAYVYPPPFRQLLEPLTWLSWPAFYAIWSGVLTLALAWLVGPLLAAMLLIPYDPFRHAIATGDVTLLMAVALCLRPAAWAVLPLLKVTPGVGLVWFAARREWRSLGVALGVTAGIVAVSYALGPELWAAWWLRMTESTGVPLIGLQIPLLIRLPLALGVVVAAARWPWLLPFGVLLAVPNPTWAAVVILAAVPRLGHRVKAEVGAGHADGRVHPHQQGVFGRGRQRHRAGSLDLDGE